VRVGGVRYQAEHGNDGERHQRSGRALISYNLSFISARKSRRINVKRSKSFLFQPNGRADRASSSALRHIHCGPTAHGGQSMSGLGQQQDPRMTKLRRHCGTVYQGLASARVWGRRRSSAIYEIAAGLIRVFPVRIVELTGPIGRKSAAVLIDLQSASHRRKCALRAGQAFANPGKPRRSGSPMPNFSDRGAKR
jgi:hypothetical protein